MTRKPPATLRAWRDLLEIATMCRDLKDARGIFCTFVCDSCEKRKRAGFRPDIFENPNYWTDEPIDEDREILDDVARFEERDIES